MNIQMTQPTTSVNYEAMVNELLSASRNVSKAIPPDHQLSLTAIDGKQYDYLTVGVKGPRQSGKSRYAAGQLHNLRTIVIVANNAMIDHMVELSRCQLQDCFVGRSHITAIEDRVVTWKTCLSDLQLYKEGKLFIGGNGIPSELGGEEDSMALYTAMQEKEGKKLPYDTLLTTPPLTCVNRVIVDEFFYMRTPLEKLLRWSRLGGRVPEFIIIN